MNNVPVILITYNRPDHTMQVLSSLKRHNVQDLYIFSDAPKAQRDISAVEQVRRLIRSVDWCAPTVIERAENFGLAKSIVSATDMVFEEFDRLILLEDDCVPQDYFFDFMHDCLEKYQDNHRIFGISGYTVPIPDQLLVGYPYDLYYSPRIGSWGWATWKRAWQHYNRNLNALVRQAVKSGVDLTQGGVDFPCYLSKYLEGTLTDVWTLHWVLSVYINNGVYVYPTRSHVSNIGHDGSGVHCSKSHGYDAIFAKSRPTRFPDVVSLSPELLANFKSFYQVPEVAVKQAIQSLRCLIAGHDLGPDNLNIAYVNTLDMRGGAAKVHWDLKEGLANLGHATRSFVGQKTTDDPVVHVIKDAILDANDASKQTGLLSYHIKSTFKLPADPRILQADIVHLHNLHGNYFNLFALPQITKVKPCVWTLHDMHALTGHCAYAYDCDRWQTGCHTCPNLKEPPAIEVDATEKMWRDKKEIYAGSDFELIVPSAWLRNIVGKSILRDKPCHLIYNGIDTSVFKPKNRDEIRRKFKVPEGAVVLGFSADGGLHNLRKGTEFIVEAYKCLINRYQNVVFLNIGGISNTKLPRLMEIPYVVDPAQLTDLYSLVDVFLFPTLADNCPLCALELMACAVPVVSFKTGGVPELIEDGRCGLLADYRNAAQFISAIEKLITDPGARSAFGACGHDRVNKYYTHEMMLDKHLALYRDVIDRRRRKENQPARTMLSASAGPQVSKKEYLVTAIVSTYNAERFMRGCLENLESQTIADKLEIIVVDSGSQQNEGQIVREFQQRYNNIKYIHTGRETIYSAWNRGIKAASGKYITNANTDDRHYKDSLEKLAMALEQNPQKVIAYGRQHVTSTLDGEIVGELGSELDHLKLLKGVCLESQPMWRKDLHDAVGYFDEQFFCSGDYEFWIRATQRFEMLYVDIFTGKRLVNDAVFSLTNKSLLSFENRIITQSYSYAIRTREPIGKQGLSSDARMANWPEMKIWRRRVTAKLTGKDWQPGDETIDVKDMRAGYKPKLSVVVIEAEATGWQCVWSLAAQSNQDFELIIIACDGSPAQPDLSVFTGRICIVRLKDDIGPSFARNIGISQARGDLIAYLDSNMQVAPGWVDAALRQFANPQVMAVRGQIVGNNDSRQATVTESYATFCENADNCAFRKSVLLEVKGFDEDLFALEGTELSYRIYESAGNVLDVIRFEPGMAAGLDVAGSESKQIIREIRNSLMWLLLWRKHKDIEGYIEFYRSQGPYAPRRCGNEYAKTVSVVAFLQKNHPELAVKWMEKEMAMNPDSVACRYVLGNLYLRLGRYDDACGLLENILKPVEDVLINGRACSPDAGKNFLFQIACCYVSACIGLAQCYIKQGNYEKVKEVYGKVLNKPYLSITQEQKAAMLYVLGKLGKTSPVPARALRSTQIAENTPSIEKPAGSDVTYELIAEKIGRVNGFLEQPNDERFLFEVAKSLPDDATIVEIGSYEGRSTCCLAYACLGTRKKVYSIDLCFTNPTSFAKWKENVERNGLQDYVTPVPGDSRKVVHQWDKSIDLIFIDGSHSYKPVLSDFIGFFPWVKDHGVVAFHDVSPNCTGPTRVWQENARQFLYDTGFCGGIAFGRKIPAGASLDKTRPAPQVSIAKYHTRDHSLPPRRPLRTVEFSPQVKCNPTLLTDAKAHKVLIVHLGSAGDLVLFTSMLHLYRKKYPDSHIAICVEENVAELVLPCPYIDEVITCNTNVAKIDPEYLKQLASQIRNRKFDIAIHPVYSRTEIGDFITLAADAKERIGFDNTEGDVQPAIRRRNNPLYTTLINVYEPGMLESEKYCFFTQSLNMGPVGPFVPTLWVTPEDVGYVDNLLKTLGINNPIVIHPFSPDAVAQWPVHHWMELISHYKGHPIIITGRKEDREKGDAVLRNLQQQNVYNLCGQMTLRQSAALLHRAKLCVTFESDSVHLACAVDCPNVVVVGGGQFGRYLPYSKITTAVYVPMKCCNCNWICGYPERFCITKLKVETVRKAVDEYLGGFPRDHLPLLPQVEHVGAFPHEPVRYYIEEMEPVRDMYQQGLRLLQSNNRDSARSALEEAVTRLRPFMTIGVQWKTPGDGVHYYDIVKCYINACITLAQCYMQAGEFGKLKAVYQHLLENPVLECSSEQVLAFRTVIAKLRNVESDNSMFAAIGTRASQIAENPSAKPGTAPKYLVSAVVSTYNSEKYIRGCLEDLENQTIADKLEIIVVNSGSEQDEEAIVREFQKRYSNIVYIKTEKREGLYSAWNRAIRVASGQFLTSANTDDRHRKDALEVMADALLASPDIALVYGDQMITDTPNPTFENHHVIEIAKRPEFSRERLLFGCCVGSQPMWRKSLHDEFGGFDETLTCAADWDFWLKIAGKYKFKHIPEFLGLYYRNENGIEHGQKIHSLYERYAVGKRYGNPYISVIPLHQTVGNLLVSIVMPAYNAADYVARAIESVLIQNYRNFELIVVDDGSTDRTAEIVRSFKNELIKYFYKDNGGVASARNFGLKKAGGSFIVMLDSDDMMTPDYIARHLREFERHPEMDMVYCDDLLIDEQDKPIRVINRPEYSDPNAFISDMFRCGFPVVHFKTCIRRSVFDKIGLYDEGLIVAEDYDMIRRFAKLGLKMVHLPSALYLRRLTTTGSLSRNFNAEKAKSHFSVVRRFTETFTPEQLFPDVQWDRMPAEQKSLLAKCKTALVYLGIGEQYLGSNAPDYAEAAFEMASAQLDDCCKIEPANQQVRNLREKCRSIRAKHLSSDHRLEALSPSSVV